jgi:hypothetical protein
LDRQEAREAPCRNEPDGLLQMADQIEDDMTRAAEDCARMAAQLLIVR